MSETSGAHDVTGRHHDNDDNQAQQQVCLLRHYHLHFDCRLLVSK